jgi:alcohol dehydrogenase (cytochrome c)
MPRHSSAFALLGLLSLASAAPAQPSGGPSALLRAVADAPVTDAMLREPGAADWLMYSRTYDAQRFSPLEEIDRDNVGSLALAWSKPLAAGPLEIIPLVYRGVMYLTTPGGRDGGSRVVALDAATGDTLWEYVPPNSASSRIKALAIYGDLIYYTAPAPTGEANPIVALDAATGAVRWQTPVSVETHTAGALVVEGKVISGRACNTARSNCYLAAHDARTGKEAWRFHTSPGAGELGDESWGGTPVDERRAATWGLPGTYDPERRILYWGIANPMPNTRADRHGGNVDAIPRHAPADLYSNSTIALNPATGKLVWYYQHLPGDDWDMDVAHEKTLIRTVVDPDPRHVKWINPNVARGVERDVAVTAAEGGGLWLNDRATGEFLWATPFPYDTPHFTISHIDVATGVAHLNPDVVLTEPGATRLICYWNTRSFWPTAYSPKTNSLYVPYIDHCLSMTRASLSGDGERRTSGLRPGAVQEKLAGIAKIDMRTGEIRRIYEARLAGNGAMLATAGDLLFWGDIGQVLRAFDAETGRVLWQSEPLGATVQTSTITYAVAGKQYVAVVNAESLLGAPRLAAIAGAEIPPHRGNSINVFALSP